MTVYILTWCGFAERIHGSTLVFKTIRDGFPTADIVVVDNASIAAARTEIRDLCAAVGAQFFQLEESIQHHAFIEQTISGHQSSSGPAIICDPDVCFWESMEDLAFNGLLAGRMLPDFFDPYSGCLTFQRLHTSLLWIQDVDALRLEILKLSASFFEFSPFRPVMLQRDGQWIRYDTAAALFHAIPGKMQLFTEREMDRYDHLFCGSHLHLVAPFFTAEIRQFLHDVDGTAKSNYAGLKGLWRLQDRIFRELGDGEEIQTMEIQ